MSGERPLNSSVVSKSFSSENALYVGLYRTIKESEVFRLFLNKNLDFNDLKSKWAVNNDNPSRMVARTRIELVIPP